MGCQCSTERSSPSSPPSVRNAGARVVSSISASASVSASASASASGPVRVVHINGCVEDFYGPVITVADVTGKPSGMVLCSNSQLLNPGSPPLGLAERLPPGELYFLLPSSVFQSADSSSLVHLASMAGRLAAIARDASTPVCRRDIGGFAGMKAGGAAGPGGGYAWDGGRMRFGMRLPWRPALETIEEKSVNGPTTTTAGNADGSVRGAGA